MPMTQDEVFAKVRDILVEALGVDEPDVTPDAAIMGDLGAESIDILDIIFRLEKGFGIKIPTGDLFPDNVLNNPEFVVNGKLTPAGVAKLKETTPHIDYGDFESDPEVNKLMGLFKVQTIVNYVLRKVNG